MNILILQLNIWNGRSENFEEEFTKVMDKSPDIVCLQECFEEYTTKRRLDRGSLNHCERFIREKYWNDYEIFYSPRQTTWPVGGNYYEGTNIAHWGNVILWKRSRFAMCQSSTKFIHGSHDRYDHKDDTTLPVNLQLLILQSIEIPEVKLLVGNVHGWYGGKGYGKGDGIQQTKQSKDILQEIKQYKELPIILCGDFNIRIDTEALLLLEEGINKNGNAIRNFNIPTGRTVLYDETKKIQEPHASYIITSPHFIQKSCMVDDKSLVSDHAPVLLDCELL